MTDSIVPRTIAVAVASMAILSSMVGSFVVLTMIVDSIPLVECLMHPAQLALRIDGSAPV